MRTGRLALIVLLLAGVPSLVSAGPVTIINFDSLGDLEVVVSQYPGLTFSQTLALKAGFSLNEFEFPPRSGDVVVFDDGGPISILFGSPVLNVAGYFTYVVPLTMTVYDASNNLLGTAVSSFASNVLTSGDPGSAPNELLALAFPGITSVTISGDLAGGSFTLDDFAYEATEQVPVPEPGGTLSLLALGAAGLSLMRRVGRRD